MPGVHSGVGYLNRYYQFLLTLLRASSDLLTTILGILCFKRSPGKTAGPKPAIAFQAFATHLAQFYGPVIKDLVKDKTFELYFIILSHPQFFKSEFIKLREMAVNSFGIDPRNVRPFWKSQWVRFDMVIYSDIYARFPFRTKKNGLLFHGVANPLRVFKKKIFRKRVFDFDFALPFGKYDEDLIREQENGTNKHPRLYAAGCPFFDRFLNPEISRDDYYSQLQLDRDKKTILFAPHWDMNHLSPGEAVDMILDLITTLASLQVNLVIKLHRMSYVKAANRGIDWHKILENALPSNVKVVDDIDDTYSLLYSDILVSGISSRVFNFMLLDKPAVLYSPLCVSTDDVDEKRQHLMRRGALVATTLTNLTFAVSESLTNPNLLGSKRREIAAMCFSHFGESTAKVADSIKKELASK